MMVRLLARQFFEFHHFMIFMLWAVGGLTLQVPGLVYGYLTFLFVRMVLGVSPKHAQYYGWGMVIGYSVMEVFSVISS